MWTCSKCGEQIEEQFDSCWKCAPVAEQPQSERKPLTLSFFVLAVLMSVLAPVLADCLHSVEVLISGIRIYNAPLVHLASSGYWVLLGLRAVMTFLPIWVFARVRLGHMFVWGCFVIVWLFLDTQADIVSKYMA